MEIDTEQLRKVAGALGTPLDVLQAALESGGAVHLASMGEGEAQVALSAIAAAAPAAPPPNRTRYWRGADGALAATDRDMSATMTELTPGDYEAAVADARAAADAFRESSIADAVSAADERRAARAAALAKLAEAAGLTPEEMEALL